MNEAAIVLTGITKRYGQRPALNGVDLEVPRGSFFALLGPNGAGKSTLLRTLMGLIRPDGGSGQVLGVPIDGAYPPVALKGRIGYVSQHQALYGEQTARELASMCATLNPRWNAGVVQRYLEMFSLPARLPVRQMSTGMKALLALTLVMGGDPELLVLDEPTLGLDPVNRLQYMQALLADSMAVGRTVLLSSHDLYQIERMADQVAILHQGKVIVRGAVDDLKLCEKRIRVAGEVTREALLAVPGIRRAIREQNGWLLQARGDETALRGELSRVPGVTAVQVFDQSLEEIFLGYVT